MQYRISRPGLVDPVVGEIMKPSISISTLHPISLYRSRCRN